MKTSDLSSKQPVQPKSVSGKKAEQKPKSSQKQFKEVLQEAKPSRTDSGKGKHFTPLEKKTFKMGEEKPSLSKTSLGSKALQEKPEGDIKLHARIEPKEERDTLGLLSKKAKEELHDPLNPTLPNLTQPGTPQIQSNKAISETHNTALNVSEIESIVKQVQVGVNEKGLPEMNFELHTENLGDVSLKVNAENDQISIQFVTQDAAAQDLLNQNLKELNQVLHNKGLNIAELDVRTRDDQSERQQQQQQQSSGEEDYSGSGQ